VLDLSHGHERTSLETKHQSARPVAITHANSARFHPARRDKSDRRLKAPVS